MRGPRPPPRPGLGPPLLVIITFVSQCMLYAVIMHALYCGFADKMLSCLKKGLSCVWHSATKPYASVKLKQVPVTCVSDVWRRHESNYNAYPTFDTPSPYKARKGVRRFYEYKLHAGGNKSSAFLSLFILMINHLANYGCRLKCK